MTILGWIIVGKKQALNLAVLCRKISNAFFDWMNTVYR